MVRQIEAVDGVVGALRAFGYAPVTMGGASCDAIRRNAAEDLMPQMPQDHFAKTPYAMV